jgi:hypothetical protein
MITMNPNTIRGLVFSQFHAKLGPIAIACTPSDLSKKVRNIVSLKSINVLTGDSEYVPKDLSIIPFPSINLKGLVKNIRKTVIGKRGNTVDSSLTLVFESSDGEILYKNISHFEKVFNQLAIAILNLKQETPQMIEEILKEFYLIFLKEIQNLAIIELAVDDNLKNNPVNNTVKLVKEIETLYTKNIQLQYENEKYKAQELQQNLINPQSKLQKTDNLSEFV